MASGLKLGSGQRVHHERPEGQEVRRKQRLAESGEEVAETLDHIGRKRIGLSQVVTLVLKEWKLDICSLVTDHRSQVRGTLDVMTHRPRKVDQAWFGLGLGQVQTRLAKGSGKFACWFRNSSGVKLFCLQA